MMLKKLGMSRMLMACSTSKKDRAMQLKGLHRASKAKIKGFNTYVQAGLHPDSKKMP